MLHTANDDFDHNIREALKPDWEAYKEDPDFHGTLEEFVQSDPVRNQNFSLRLAERAVEYIDFNNLMEDE
jgi:hypothetical protein